MKSPCERTQELLAEQGIEALKRDTELQAHVGSCEECFAFLEALGELDEALSGLPEHHPADELVSETLRRVAAEPRLIAAKAPSPLPSPQEVMRAVRRLFTSRRPRYALATCASLALVLLVLMPKFEQSRMMKGGATAAKVSAEANIPEAPRLANDKAAANLRDSFEKNNEALDQQQALLGALDDAEQGAPVESGKGNPSSAGRADGVVDHFGEAGTEDDSLSKTSPRQALSGDGAQVGAAAGSELRRKESESFANQPTLKSQDADELERVPEPIPGAAGIAQPSSTAANSMLSEEQSPADAGALIGADKKREQAKVVQERLRDEPMAAKDLRVPPPAPPAKPVAASKPVMHATGGAAPSVEAKAKSDRRSVPAESAAAEPARYGFASKEQGKRELGQSSQSAQVLPPALPDSVSVATLLPLPVAPLPATGYWSNTYLPGDSAVRRLQSLLRGVPQSELSRILGSAADLRERSRQEQQPFSAPERAALGLQLNADLLAVDGPTRLMLQVGIQGAERSTGHRAPMNLALVVDASEQPTPEALDEMRQVAASFNKAKDVGDRIQLFVAGRAGIEALSAEQFRHGSLSVTFDRLASQPSGTGEGDIPALPDVYRTALQSIGGSEEQAAPLGSSSVVIITSRTLQADSPTFQSLAHRSAVEGVSTSIVAIGAKATSAEATSIALAGQGSLYSLNLGEDPAPVIQKELSQVSRGIARALRLRIRLAPGVKLYGILGSHRLDHSESTKVRQMEQSIDKKLSRALGIASDRGDDEEGIQVVIPAFYSSDSHVILLDVEVPGAGPVADVRLRYKDLLNVKNAVATTTLSLAKGHARRTPLEHNVVSNALAFGISETFGLVSEALKHGNLPGAEQLVSERLSRYQRIAEVDPSLHGESMLAGRLALLSDLQTTLANSSALLQRPADRAILQSSLSVASRTLVTTHPFGEDIP